MGISRTSKAIGASRPGPPSAADTFRTKYPLLCDHLFLTEFDDGAKRAPSTMTFFQEDGCYKACLNNKSESLVAFVTSDTFTGLLDALELSLSDETIDWRKASTGKRTK